ncbi:MAG: asparaginase [Rhodobacteraceae bacterium]|nr:MAG: asparaginase [Paracoccaceae bacterium]
MGQAVAMVDVRRGDIVESRHLGHAVICDEMGQVVQAWGDPSALIYPRSACKMIQALPLVESGAADRAGLTAEHLALACASHNGARIHTDRVTRWLADLGLGEGDLRCGSHLPYDEDRAHEMIRAGETPCQIHNNCSGKHCGFLTLARDMKAGPEYVEVDHPVQKAALEAFKRTTGEASPGWAVDGCSAPNFQTTLLGLARAMAGFAAAGDGPKARLRDAMMAHPDLVAGEGRACTELMRAAREPLALKTGAEGVFTAILPGRRLGLALKIADGATRASECATAAILVALGALERDHPATKKRLDAPIVSRRGIPAGRISAAEGLISG